MITVQGVSKGFGSIKVVNNISICINKGELVAIVGPSGAGKTTLLQLIGALDTPDQGNVMYNNERLANLNRSQLAHFRNKHIGFIFQFHQLLPEFTALENVCIPAWINKESEFDPKNRAMELLTFLGLEHRFDHKPAQLSGGEAQRVAVARALINSPDVILADEPSGNLDSQNANDLHDLFFSLRDKFNQTFIIVTHNKELAARADRVITMKDGELVDSL